MMDKTSLPALGADDEGFRTRVKRFGDRLKDARMRLALTQEEFADKLGVKRQTVSNWEAGVTTPDVAALLKIRDVAQGQTPVDLGELLGEIRLDSGRTPLSFAIQLLQVVDTMGIRNVYENRAAGLLGFLGPLESETKSITVVCSSFLGVLRVAPQKVAELLRLKADKVEWSILMTHPEMSQWREQQEDRSRGSIAKEIQESVDVLTNDWKIPADSIRFYKGAPTVFLLFTPERMLLNPYTFRTEAFKTFTLEVARTHSGNDIYTQYEQNHFERSWNGPNTEAINVSQKTPAGKGKRNVP